MSSRKGASQSNGQTDRQPPWLPRRCPRPPLVGGSARRSPARTYERLCNHLQPGHRPQHGRVLLVKRVPARGRGRWRGGVSQGGQYLPCHRPGTRLPPPPQPPPGAAPEVVACQVLELGNAVAARRQRRRAPHALLNRGLQQTRACNVSLGAERRGTEGAARQAVCSPWCNSTHHSGNSTRWLVGGRPPPQSAPPLLSTTRCHHNGAHQLPPPRLLLQTQAQRRQGMHSPCSAPRHGHCASGRAGAKPPTENFRTVLVVGFGAGVPPLH